MSGGSFDYLCHKELDYFMCTERGLDEMICALAELGYAEDAAVATQQFLLDLRKAKVRLEASLSDLQPVWKAIEWWKSCDTSEDAFKKALAKWRGETDESSE